jgi:hypothetical protein
MIGGKSIVVDNPVVETPVAEETALNLTLIPNNNLFCTSQLYAVAKPIILVLQEKVKGLIPIGDCWGMLRTSQLLEHVFNRTKYLFSILKTPSTETLDTQMIDSAVDYLAALQTNHGGTNFKDNEYVRMHVLEALMPPVLKSGRALAKRLKVNRNIVPDIIAKRLQFNELVSTRDASSPVIPGETVSMLEENASDFESNHSPDELGLMHLFTQLNVSAEDDFFSSDNVDEIQRKFSVKKSDIFSCCSNILLRLLHPVSVFKINQAKQRK